MRRSAPLLIAFLSLSLAAPSFAAEPPVTVTIYNNNLAMVQEVRNLHLARGMQEYRIADVTAEIDPASVRLKSLTAPESVTLQEQRFEFDLTAREREVLGLLVEGSTNREISEQLSIGMATVKYHLTNIFSKLGAKNRVEAVTIALEHNLVDKHN
jgi:DNA-binding NarL/FixJ family response regulator